MRTRSRAQSTKPSAADNEDDDDDTDLSPASFAFAATRVAASQIVHSKGFKSAHRSAIDILADAAGKYLQTLAETAAASAASMGRTECNLYDVIAGLETLAAVQGFLGASSLNRPILSSSTLTELSRFVKFSLEMPFAQAIRRHPPPHRTVRQLVGTAHGHIPRWLPAVPDMAVNREAGGRRKEEGPYGCLASDETRVAFSGNEGGHEEERNGVRVDSHREKEGVLVDKKMRTGLPKKRGRVRFKIGVRERGLGVGLRGGVLRVGKRILCGNQIDDDKKGDGNNSKRRKKMKCSASFNTQD